MDSINETAQAAPADAPAAGAPAVVDFTSFTAVDSITVDILALDGISLTGWKITIAGPSHPLAIKWGEEQARKNLQKEQMIERMRVNNRKYTGDTKTLDDQKKENADWIATRILSWSPIALPFIFGNNDPVPCTRDNAMRMLMEPKMTFVYMQLVEVVGEDKRFMQRSQ